MVINNSVSWDEIFFVIYEYQRCLIPMFMLVGENDFIMQVGAFYKIPLQMIRRISSQSFLNAKHFRSVCVK